MKAGSWWYVVVGDDCEIIADEDGVPMHVLVRHQKKNR